MISYGSRKKLDAYDLLKKSCYLLINLKLLMSLESILMVVAPICLFTVGVIVLPILVKPRKQSGLPKRYIRGL